jgi:hypothetical protein
MTTAKERSAAYMEALYQLRDRRRNVFAGFRAEEAADEPNGSPSLVYARALYRLRDSYRNWFDRLYGDELARRGIV